MRLFYVFTFCRQQVRNEPAIAHLRMFLLLGVTAAAVVLQELKLEPRLKRSKTLASQLDALDFAHPSGPYGQRKSYPTINLHTQSVKIHRPYNPPRSPASRLTERHPQVPSDRSLSGEPGLW